VIDRPPRPRILLIAFAAALLALALIVAPASATKPPQTMAALGDSITRAFNSSGPGCPTGPGLDCPQNSWSTGTNPAVDSQLQRIEAMHPGDDVVAFNDAVSGARAAGLLAQAQVAASQDPDSVTIEIGANDACASTPTAVGTFGDQVEAALGALVTGNPKVYVELASIPDVNQLHTLFTSPPDSNALTRWAALDVCQGLLADPLSTEPADVARRAAFRDRVIAYNGALAQACAEFKRCRWDRNAVFDASFTRDDVATVSNTEGLPVFPFNVLPVFGPGFPDSTADYFHPSLQGQALLAETTWGATFRDFAARGQGALSH
jgi:lysophospholipase L1-like esterase